MIRAILIARLAISTAGAASADATHEMVASVHPTATEAGLRVLQQGGNAVDAAVAVALTLGVVDGDNSGIGGGCFILIHRAGTAGGGEGGGGAGLWLYSKDGGTGVEVVSADRPEEPSLSADGKYLYYQIGITQGIV